MGQKTEVVSEAPVNRDSKGVVVTVEGRLEFQVCAFCCIYPAYYRAQRGIARHRAHDGIYISHGEDLDSSHEIIGQRDGRVVVDEIVEACGYLLCITVSQVRLIGID